MDVGKLIKSISIVNSELKNLPYLRINKIIRLWACFLIAAVSACSYWGFLTLVELHIEVAFSEMISGNLRQYTYFLFGMYIICEVLVSPVVAHIVAAKYVYDDKRWSSHMLKWNYIMSLVELLFSWCLLLYAINGTLEAIYGWRNYGVGVSVAACAYLVKDIYEKTHHEFQELWQRWNRLYIGYYDENGKEIYEGAVVSYYRKKYCVERNTSETFKKCSEWILRSSDNGLNTKYIYLEDAARDEKGHIALKEK